MTSRCDSCTNPIVNADYVSCAGACKGLFHLKCVAVSKAMLNTINSCPNLHWYCHKCNSGNRDISASIDRINEAIGLLTNSLSGDLIQFVNGYKTLTEEFMKTICRSIVTNGTNSADSQKEIYVPNDNQSPSVSHQSSLLESDCSTPVTNHNATHSEQSTNESDLAPPKCTTPGTNQHNRGALRSVVISNVGKDITVKYLSDYLSDELKIDKDKIGVSLLLPAGKTVDLLNFLQFKITIPNDKYCAIMNPVSWPTNIRVRDFVYKRKEIDVVQKRHFLSRKPLCPNF